MHMHVQIIIYTYIYKSMCNCVYIIAAGMKDLEMYACMQIVYCSTLPTRWKLNLCMCMHTHYMYSYTYINYIAIVARYTYICRL